MIFKHVVISEHPTGHLIGPFELADFIGLDTCKFIVEGWSRKFPTEPLFR